MHKNEKKNMRNVIVNCIIILFKNVRCAKKAFKNTSRDTEKSNKNYTELHTFDNLKTGFKIAQLVLL